MKDNFPRVARSHSRTLLLLAALLLGGAACRGPSPLKLHYLPGFVAGSERIYAPAKIAVVEPAGQLASGRFEIGGIYGDDGSDRARLYIEDFGATLNTAMLRALTDAGLEPAAIESAPADGEPPDGIDFMLTVSIDAVSVDKRFTTEQTIHGQYFRMKSEVQLTFALTARGAAAPIKGEALGLEEEPPAPVGGEVFLPLETEPAESLSVALSRAVGELVTEPRFRAVLPAAAATS